VKTSANSQIRAVAAPILSCRNDPFLHAIKGTTMISAVVNNAPAREAPAITDAYIAAPITANRSDRRPPPSVRMIANGSSISMNAAYRSRLRKGPSTADS
jgi:hypothetical protein